MAEKVEKYGFLEKIDHWLAILTAIPVFGVIIKKIFEAIAEKGAKKFNEALGLSSEAASKTYDDEISFEKVLVKGTLTPKEKTAIKEWLGRLRESDPKLAGEFTRWVHNSLVKLGRQVKISTGPKENREERTFVDDTEGIAIAEALVRDVLAATDGPSRLAVLKQRDIKVVPKKPSPVAEKAKEFAKKAAEKATEAGKKVGAEQKANFEEHKKSAASFEKAAKQYLANARARRQK